MKPIHLFSAGKTTFGISFTLHAFVLEINKDGLVYNVEEKILFRYIIHEQLLGETSNRSPSPKSIFQRFEIMNALVPLANRPVFAILPGGTCNDFSRTLGISQKPLEALEQIINDSWRDGLRKKQRIRTTFTFYSAG